MVNIDATGQHFETVIIAPEQCAHRPDRVCGASGSAKNSVLWPLGRQRRRTDIQILLDEWTLGEEVSKSRNASRAAHAWINAAADRLVLESAHAEGEVGTTRPLRRWQPTCRPSGAQEMAREQAATRHAGTLQVDVRLDLVAELPEENIYEFHGDSAIGQGPSDHRSPVDTDTSRRD